MLVTDLERNAGHDPGMSRMTSATAPLVAVVTPIYNGAEYLRATMQCVQAQDYPNLVHVVLDNGSTDSTPSILDEFEQGAVPLLRMRNDRTLPQRDNWNRAMSLVPNDARYVKWLCADDLMRGDCISKFVAAAEAAPELEVVLSHDVFNDVVRSANLPGSGIRHDGKEVARRILSGEIEWMAYNHLFVRWHAAQAAEGFFPARPIYFDRYVVVRQALQGEVAYLPEPLLYTRWHAGTVTSQHLGAKQVVPFLLELDIVTTYGAQCWDAEGYRRAIARQLGRLARHVLRWTAVGEHEAAAAMRDELRQRGFALSPLAYLRHALAWPAHALRKHGWAQPRTRRMTEAEFVSAATAPVKR